MYSEKIEQLIKAALADGVLTEKERQILLRKAQEEGIDLEEFEMVLDAKVLELNKSAQPTAPKSDKLGDKIKCPNCLQTVNSFDGICPHCGYAFENIQANQSSSKLFDLLQQANTANSSKNIIGNVLQNTMDQNRKERIIAEFPLPMTKSDMLEFITYLHPHVYNSTMGGFTSTSSGYHAKYTECMHKCRVSFSEDSSIKYYLDEFESTQKKDARQFKIIITIALVIGIPLCILVLLFGGDLGLF